jgi:hypothetical protein
MKLQRKHYPIACLFFFILVIGFSAIHAYKPVQKEGFLESINETINSSNRKLKIFKEDMSNVADTGARAVKKLFRS